MVKITKDNLNEWLDSLWESQIELEEKQNKVEEIKQALQSYMQNESRNKISSNGVKLSLCKKGGKKKLSPEALSSIGEIEKEIELERSEMISNNKQRIYELESSIVKNQAELRSLTSNVWIEEMEQKLEETKESFKDNTVTEYYLKVKLEDAD